jgi:CRISPR-associated protein Cas2
VSKDGTYIIAYDIKDDKERNRVSKVLSGYGFRVQKSVFECRLTRSSLAKINTKLEELEICTGCILIYRLNQNAKRLKIGECPGIRDEEEYAFVV